MTTTFPTESPPAIAQIGPIAWLRKNLFNSWFNSGLTIILGVLLARVVMGTFTWATTVAQWAVIPVNLPRYFAGLYPPDQYWRLWILLTIIATLAGATWGILARNQVKLFSRSVLIGIGIVAAIAAITPTPLLYRGLLLGLIGIVVAGAWVGRHLGKTIPSSGQWLSLAWSISFFLALWLLLGGLGLKEVSTTVWGGLLLTLFMAVVSIILCFPLGVLLALGRQSSLPIIRWLCVLFIEVIRGLPLITILFFGSVLIPLFLAKGVRLDQVVRAIVALTFFSSAYLAENVRGGLQSVPRGQTEAARALGLNTPLTTALIVLPQALKVSIPAIVGQFISLVQDTTLTSIIGLSELLGISRQVLANPEFIGRYWEVYTFIGVIYWIICYSMSWGSRRLEDSLNTGR